MGGHRTIWVTAAVSLLLVAGCGNNGSDSTTTSAPGGTDSTEAPETSADLDEVTAPSIDELLEVDEPLLLAHAGGDRDAPQETVYAYTLAAEAGSDVLEMDVMLSADGELVVHHDDTVDRLTNGTGAVAELTLEELQELDAAHWWIPGCTNGSCRELPPAEYPYRGVRTGDTEPPEGFTAEDFRIPTFAEIAEGFPELPLDVEIKGEGEPAYAAADALASELERLDRVGSTVVVSFDATVVEHMRERLPEVATSPGLSTMAEWVLAGEPLEGYPVVQIPPTYRGVDLLTLVLDEAADAGVDVWVWPDDADAQENADYYQQLLDAGVDGVIAGSPSSWPG